MADQPTSAAGGFLLCVAIFLGAGIGMWRGQPSAGLLGGVIVGTALAVAVWIRDRRRIGR